MKDFETFDENDLKAFDENALEENDLDKMANELLKKVGNKPKKSDKAMKPENNPAWTDLSNNPIEKEQSAWKKLMEARKTRDTAKGAIKEGNQGYAQAKRAAGLENAKDFGNEFVAGSGALSYHPFIQTLLKNQKVTAVPKSGFREQYKDDLARIENEADTDPEFQQQLGMRIKEMRKANKEKDAERIAKGLNPREYSGLARRALINEAQTKFINDKYKKAGNFDLDDFGNVKKAKQTDSMGFSGSTIKAISDLIAKDDPTIKETYQDIKNRVRDGQPCGPADKQFVDLVEKQLGITQAKNDYEAERANVKDIRDDWSKANKEKKAYEKSVEAELNAMRGPGKEAKVVPADGWYWLTGVGKPYAMHLEKDENGDKRWRAYTVTNSDETHGSFGSPDIGSTAPVFDIPYEDSETAQEKFKHWAMDAGRVEGKSIIGKRAAAARMEDTAEKYAGRNIIALKDKMGPLYVLRFMNWLKKNNKGIVAADGTIYSNDRFAEYEPGMSTYKDWPKSKEERAQQTKVMGSIRAQKLEDMYNRQMERAKNDPSFKPNVKKLDDGRYMQIFTGDNIIHVGGSRDGQPGYYINLNSPHNKEIIEQYAKEWGIDDPKKVPIMDIPITEFDTTGGARKGVAQMTPEEIAKSDVKAKKREAKRQANRANIEKSGIDLSDIINLVAGVGYEGAPRGLKTERK